MKRVRWHHVNSNIEQIRQGKLPNGIGKTSYRMDVNLYMVKDNLRK